MKKEVSELRIEVLRPNPRQPRRTFDEVGLAELAESLKLHGVLQPVVVRPAAGGFEIIAGERRWRAARLAGLATLPAIVRSDVSDEEMLELALVENVQRADLDAIERARGYRAMMDALGITQEEVARKVGLQRATVTNHIRLLDLPSEVQEAISRGMISMGHARALLGLKAVDLQRRAVERIAREGLSVRQVEAFARDQSTKQEIPPGRVKTLVPHQPWIGDLERRLRDRLGTKISILNGRGFRGQIVLQYYDRQGLDRLCEVLAPAPHIS